MKWMKKAREYIGEKEIRGKVHNPLILDLWEAAKLPFKDDETPWCAGFVNGVLEKCGIQGTRSGMARSFLKWGKKIDQPIPGTVVVLRRGAPPSGHVGFITAAYPTTIRVLGGNQGDAVNERLFKRSEVLGYRWPPKQPIPGKKSAAKSKIAAGAGGVGTVESADLATQVTEAIEKVEPAATAASHLGITEYIGDVFMQLATSPRFWITLGIIAVCAAIIYWRWRDH
jgi:uncharacterized protein (TIGR02594 family)